MKASALEIFLARLYTDEAFCSAFLAEPAAIARGAGLDDAAVQALLSIDRAGLEFAAESFSRKRASYAGRRARRSLLNCLREWFGTWLLSTTRQQKGHETRLPASGMDILDQQRYSSHNLSSTASSAPTRGV